MNWFGGASKLLAKVNDIHEKFIEANTEFKLLRNQTETTLFEFKRALERLSSKVETVQQEQTKAYAELRAEIRGLEHRLNAFSEQAFHAVAERAVRDELQARRSKVAVPDATLPASGTDE